MKNKQTLINMISNIIAFSINIGITFFLTPYIVKKIGSESYSFISISNSFVSIATIITIALNSMASRFISIEINANRIGKANEYFSSVFIANIIMSIALTIPSLFCLMFIDVILNVPMNMIIDVKLTFAFVFANIIISVIGNVFAVATFAKNRLDLSSLRLIQGNLLRGVVTVGLFILFDPKIYYITITTLIVTIFTITTNINYTKKLIPEIKLSYKYFSKNAVKTLLSSGIWNSLNQLSNVLLNQVDIIIANILVGVLASGQYSIVKTVPGFMFSFIAMITNVFVPQFIILYAKQASDDLVKKINSSMNIISLIITIPIGYLLVFGDVFFSLWLPGENYESLQMLSQITLIPLIISGCGNMIFNIFTITNKLKLPSIVMLISGVIKIIIMILILKFVNIGIIIIPLVSSIINIIIYLTFIPIYAAFCLNVKKKTFYSPLVKSVFCTIIMVTFCLVSKNLIAVNSWERLFTTAIIIGLAVVVVNFFTIFSKVERKEMINQMLKN